MVRSTIRDLSRKLLGETTASFWTNPELNGWIDLACDDLAFRAKCIRDDDKMTTVAETAEYVLSTHFPTALAVLEVYYYLNGTTWDKLDSTSRDKLNIEEAGWKSATSGTPDRYYWSKKEDMIGFYVKPNATNAGTDYAEVYFAKKHTAITTDSATIDIPEPLHLAIVDWVVATGLDSRGWGDKANDKWQKYFSKIHDYTVESAREDEDEDITMKSYRNIR